MRATAARLTAVVAAAAVAVSAGAASARTEGIGFSFLPQHAVQGTATHISVNVKPAGVRCTLTVRYHNGATQAGLAPAVASGGHASWAWSVPTNVQAGVAKATVHCSSAGTV